MYKGVEALPTLSHKHLRVLARVGLVKCRQAFALSDNPVVNNVFFYNNSISVCLRALTERLYYVKGKDGFVPCPKPTAPFSTMSYFLKGLRRQLPEFPSVWTTEQFVQSYTGSKKLRYESAVANLARRGLRRQDGYLKTFIKAELYDGTNKLNPCPRLIQPRTPEYNVVIGCYLRPAEKLIYKAIDRVFNHHVVLKCDNPWKRAATICEYWNEFERPCFVGLDASRFDQHVSVEALEFEHSLYNSIFKSGELAELLQWQIDQTGFANLVDGSIKYKVEGCRASGDMNTALGNVVLMCALTHHYLRDLPCKWRFINDGDDCGIFLEKGDVHLLNGLPDHHLSFGFEMEVEEPAFELEGVEFCQSRPINLGNGNWMMVRNIFKAMRHDWISLTSRNYCTFEENLVATGRCGLALYAGVPVLDAMYSAMCRFPIREKVVQRVLMEEHSGLGRTWRMFASASRKFPVDETVARVSIHKAFGLLPDEQECLEDKYRALDPQCTSSNSPLYQDPSLRIQYLLD